MVLDGVVRGVVFLERFSFVSLGFGVSVFILGVLRGSIFFCEIISSMVFRRIGWRVRVGVRVGLLLFCELREILERVIDGDIMIVFIILLEIVCGLVCELLLLL